MRKKTKYATIGFVVSKFVLPVAKRQAKKTVKKRSQGAAVSSANAAGRHPARTGIAVGAAVGAIGWLIARAHASAREEDLDQR